MTFGDKVYYLKHGEILTALYVSDYSATVANLATDRAAIIQVDKSVVNKDFNSIIDGQIEKVKREYQQALDNERARYDIKLRSLNELQAKLQLEEDSKDEAV